MRSGRRRRRSQRSSIPNPSGRCRLEQACDRLGGNRSPASGLADSGLRWNQEPSPRLGPPVRSPSTSASEATSESGLQEPDPETVADRKRRPRAGAHRTAHHRVDQMLRGFEHEAIADVRRDRVEIGETGCRCRGRSCRSRPSTSRPRETGPSSAVIVFGPSSHVMWFFATKHRRVLLQAVEEVVVRDRSKIRSVRTSSIGPGSRARSNDPVELAGAPLQGAGGRRRGARTGSEQRAARERPTRPG